MAARKWTPEQRALQAQRVQQWKPWEKSTGPKTQQGKAVVRQNALIHGLRASQPNDLGELIENMQALLSGLST